MRILIVEDNAVTGSSLAEVLRLAGHEPDWAANADAARVKLTVSKPDVVLIDYVLGGGADGLELMREFQAMPNLAGVPMILTTAMPRDHLGEESGSLMVLQKPFAPAALLDVLKVFEAAKPPPASGKLGRNKPPKQAVTEAADNLALAEKAQASTAFAAKAADVAAEDAKASADAAQGTKDEEEAK